MYNCLITLSIPEGLRTIGNSIARAFDPDVGGEYTFDSEAVEGTINVTFPCVQKFAEAMPFFKNFPDALYESVKRDYEQRWSEQTPPTLDECIQFCENVKINGE